VDADTTAAAQNDAALPPASPAHAVAPLVVEPPVGDADTVTGSEQEFQPAEDESGKPAPDVPDETPRSEVEVPETGDDQGDLTATSEPVRVEEVEAADGPEETLRSVTPEEIAARKRAESGDDQAEIAVASEPAGAGEAQAPKSTILLIMEESSERQSGAPAKLPPAADGAPLETERPGDAVEPAALETPPVVAVDPDADAKRAIADRSKAILDSISGLLGDDGPADEAGGPAARPEVRTAESLMDDITALRSFVKQEIIDKLKGNLSTDQALSDMERVLSEVEAVIPRFKEMLTAIKQQVPVVAASLKAAVDQANRVIAASGVEGVNPMMEKELAMIAAIPAKMNFAKKAKTAEMLRAIEQELEKEKARVRALLVSDAVNLLAELNAGLPAAAEPDEAETAFLEVVETAKQQLILLLANQELDAVSQTLEVAQNFKAEKARYAGTIQDDINQALEMLRAVTDDIAKAPEDINLAISGSAAEVKSQLDAASVIIQNENSTVSAILSAVNLAKSARSVFAAEHQRVRDLIAAAEESQRQALATRSGDLLATVTALLEDDDGTAPAEPATASPDATLSSFKCNLDTSLPSPPYKN